MPKTKIKRQNISINTGEPIEEKELDLNPLAILAPDAEEKEDEDDELEELMVDEDEDVKMMQAGLLVPSDSNVALPHSVRLQRRWI